MGQEGLNKLDVFWSEVTFGIRYIWQHDSLRTLLIVILNSLFSPIFGNGAGAGMALLYVVCAISLRHDFVTPCLLLAQSAIDYRNYINWKMRLLILRKLLYSRCLLCFRILPI